MSEDLSALRVVWDDVLNNDKWLNFFSTKTIF